MPKKVKVFIWRIDEPEDNFQIMLEGHTKEGAKICFSPNGGLLASRSNDDTVRVWRASDWRCVAIINVSTSFAGTNAYFPALAFHPSEPLLATCVDRPDEISILELDEKALINAAFDM
jgi:WD40 repeat protein